jgi:hypothetical protein
MTRRVLRGKKTGETVVLSIGLAWLIAGPPGFSLDCLSNELVGKASFFDVVRDRCMAGPDCDAAWASTAAR